MEYTRNYDKDLDELDNECLMTISDFDEQLNTGMIQPYDGHGYYVKNGKKSTECEAISSLFNFDATHVVWYGQ